MREGRLLLTPTGTVEQGPKGFERPVQEGQDEAHEGPSSVGVCSDREATTLIVILRAAQFKR
jgi:hypothetical protein